MSRAFLLHAMPKRSVCAEIGVHLGDFSQDILEVVAPAELHLIDPWKFEAAGLYRHSWYGGPGGKSQEEMNRRYWHVSERFKAPIDSGQIVIHRGASEQVCAIFPDQYFDWVYIDGNHLYDFVKKDLELYTPKVKDGGFITGDDYDSNGWWGNGVKQAVDEAINSGYVSRGEFKNGQFILRKNENSIRR